MTIKSNVLLQFVANNRRCNYAIEHIKRRGERLSVARDSKGRFVKGASGNPQGRLPKQVEQTYLQVAENACTFDVWHEIVAKAIEQAKHGDARARQWLSDYLIGKPLQMVMAVQRNNENALNIRWSINEKLKRLADDVSNKPITIDWDD